MKTRALDQLASVAAAAGALAAGLLLAVGLSACPPASTPLPAPPAATGTTATIAPVATSAPVPGPQAPPLPGASAPSAEPPRDPFEVELSAFCEAEAVGSVSADGKRLARVACGAAGDPPVPVARLTVTEVASGRTIRSLDVAANGGADARKAALAEMKVALAAENWIQLVVYDVEIDTAVDERFNGLGSSQARMARGEGLTVRFHEPELVVTGEKGKVVHRRAYPAWSPHVKVLGQDCVMLTDLTGVTGSKTAGILVVELTSVGSPHFCESQASEHIVRLPAAR